MMTTDRINDLKAFRSFVDETLPDGGAGLTLDEALGLWEYENAPDEERRATLDAIRLGLDDMHAGRSRPATDVLRDLCRKHGLPGPS